ncbi:hypothetical protein NQ318_014760 [Aromia moschata]|uniref:Transposase n=1 Tax=Aromia moschata TaxID=1265417 RepID=A0AAV8ZBP6_9CUCU|nr:hypothetical protein NQ318_014760 [Aromia moschata]
MLNAFIKKTHGPITFSFADTLPTGFDRTAYTPKISVLQEMLRCCEEDNQILNKILWSDESTFTTSGVFNRKNRHCWASENPHTVAPIKTQGHRSLHVRCGMLGNKIIGPLIFEGPLTGERYLNFIRNEIGDFLEDLPIRQYNDVIWQQDGAPPNNIGPVTHFLNNRYELWIGRQGPIRWPPNSPDLTPLDNLMWGYLKDKFEFGLETLGAYSTDDILVGDKCKCVA